MDTNKVDISCSASPPFYQKIYNWLTENNENKHAETTTSIGEECYFDKIPAVLYGEICSHLDAFDLKSCKEVCSFWNLNLPPKLLSKKLIQTWHGDQMGFWAYLQLFSRLTIKRESIPAQQFRLEEFNSAGISLLASFTNLAAFNSVSHLEIIKSSIHIHVLCSIITKMDNLVSLTVDDVVLNKYYFPTMEPTPEVAKREYPSWYKLKILNIIVFEHWRLNTLHSLTASLIGTYCRNLEHLNLKMYDTGIRLVDQMRPFTNVFKDFIDIMFTNAKTLKSVCLVNFDIEEDRKKEYTNGVDDTIVNGQDWLFLMFLTRFSKYSSADWSESGIQLRNLELRYRLMKMDDPQVKEVFLPFLKTQSKLEKLSLGQIYSRSGPCITVEELMNTVPTGCHCAFQAISSIKDGRTLAPALENLGNMIQDAANVEDDDEIWNDDSDSEDEDFDPNQPAQLQLQQHNVIANLPALQLINVAVLQPVGGQNQPLLQLANVLFNLEHLGNQAQVTHGYFDSTIQINTELVNVKILFAHPKNVKEVLFLSKYIDYLTEIKIQQTGITMADKITFTDEDIQRVLKYANKLKILEMEFCDLSGVTDFGLTGIAPDSCERMLVQGNYELEEGDMLGQPISAIRNLRSLKLSDLGQNVTDVSAYHAFNGLASLNSFGMFKPQMSSNGLRKIRDMFLFNQLIQIEPKTQILLTTIDNVGNA